MSLGMIHAVVSAKSLSQWELLELELADLYSLFVGSYQSLDAIRKYGKENSFEGRLSDPNYWRR